MLRLKPQSASSLRESARNAEFIACVGLICCANIALKLCTSYSPVPRALNINFSTRIIRCTRGGLADVINYPLHNPTSATGYV